MTTATSQTIPTALPATTAPQTHAPHAPAPAREVTSAMLAERLGGRLVGPPDVVVTRADALADADERTLSFIRDAAFAKDWAASRAGVALVSEGLSVDAAPGRALVFVRDADLAMVEALNMLAPAARQATPGIDPRAIIEPGAMIDPLASIGPFAVVRAGASVGEGSSIASGVVIDAGSRVGRFTTIHANVTIANASVVGDHCIIHPGVVIGADGFGYRPAPDGRGLVKIPHLGNAVLDSHVEIGANTCIDRARFGSTRIGAGTKIDNLVQIGHNCRIGRSVVICGCTGIAGSVTIGDGVQIGGNCGIADNVTIGRGARIAAKTGVMHDVPEGITVAGLPAFPGRDYLRMIAALRKLAKV